jgi:hypothetical protein
MIIVLMFDFIFSGRGLLRLKLKERQRTLVVGGCQFYNNLKQ